MESSQFLANSDPQVESICISQGLLSKNKTHAERFIEDIFCGSFSSQPGYRNIQLLTVLGYCAACHVIPLLREQLLQSLVGQRLSLILGIYSLLYHVGITPFSADDSYEAVTLNAEQAELLGVQPGSSAFYHQRRTKTEDDRIYEYTCSYIRGDRVRLDVQMQKSGMTFTRRIDD